MKRRQLGANAILLALVGIFTMQARTASPTNGNAHAQKEALRACGSTLQTTDELQILHRECTAAAKRLHDDVLAMEPGRSWRWRLDSERSRKRIHRLRHDLGEFWSSESAFEAALPPNEKSKLNPRFVQIYSLFEQLERDAQRLDTELVKGCPMSWQVDRDVSDMRKELNHCRKQHKRIAESLGLRD